MVSLPQNLDRVLVIKLGALGDFVQAMGPFQAIRAALPQAQITLLTTRPFVELATLSGWFDQVWTDQRPRSIPGYWALRRQLLAGRFDMIFDLQTSDRSGNYWRMLWPHRPLISGIVKGASHPHANPDRNQMHTLERQRDQLAMAGITTVPAPHVDWMQGDIQGVVAQACPQAIDLTGRTELFQLASLCRRAEVAVGNDTGPMHLAAVAGCPCLVLYSKASDPALCAQKGPSVRLLQVDDLGDLSVASVVDRLSGTLATR